MRYGEKNIVNVLIFEKGSGICKVIFRESEVGLVYLEIFLNKEYFK